MSISSRKCIENLYKKYSGGGEYVIGGVLDLKDYLNSPGSYAKKAFIYDIAKEFSEKMKFPGIDPDGKTDDEIIESLKKQFPCPDRKRGNNKTFSKLEQNQITACKTMAKILNDKYGNDIINIHDSPEIICDNVCEVIYSLFVGFHTEFALIKDDVTRILKNIDVLQQFLERNYRSLVGSISSEPNPAQLKLLQAAHKDVVDELYRQQTILKNILNIIIYPSQADIATIFKETEDFRGLVRKIKNYPPGTEKFAEKIAFTTDLFANTTILAKLVNESLEKIGLSITDYIKSNNEELHDKINERLEHLMNHPSNELLEYLKAVQIIYDYQYLHDQIVDELQKKEGRNELNYNEYSFYDQDIDMEDSNLVVGGLNIDKRIRTTSKIKIGYLKVFTERMSKLMKFVVTASKNIADYINSNKVELTDTLDKFVRALDEIPDLQNKHTYLTLSGYIKDVQAKQEREKYISSVKYVIYITNKCIESKEYSSIEGFKDFKKGFEEILKIIEDFSNKYEEGFGPFIPNKGRNDYETEQAIGKGEYYGSGGNTSRFAETAKKLYPPLLNLGSEALGAASKHLKEMAEAKSGKGEQNYMGGMLGTELDNSTMPNITGIGYSLNMAKDIIRYNFRTAKIRENLNKFSVEIKSYGEDYIKILADAIASAVDSVITAKNKYMESSYESNTAHPLHLLYKELTHMRKELAGTSFIFKDPKSGTELEQSRAKFLKIQEIIGKLYDNKIELYRLAEAVDLYMMKFTEAVATNPDDIKDLMHILNSTEIISKWYNNKSGDFLCQVFDTFPSNYLGIREVLNRINNSYEGLGKYHYYLRVAAITRLGNRSKMYKNGLQEFAGIDRSDWTGWANILLGVDDNTAIHKYFGQNYNDTTIINLDGVCFPGLPFLGIPVVNEKSNEDVLHLFKYMEKALSINVLKNIISMFINIGRKFDNKDLNKNMYMSPVHIYKGLINYMIYGSINIGLTDPNQRHTIVPNNDLPFLSNNTSISFMPDNLVLGINSTADNKVEDNINEKCASYAVMRSTKGIYTKQFNDIFGSQKDNNCDMIFTMIIKSIVAKILTTIGVYNIFNKPINKNGLGYQSSLRLIIGGSNDVPKIIPEALELYIRLPLLTEFYRAIFNLDNDDTSNFVTTISLIPEFDNIFSGLISIIFDKAKYVKEGEYSSNNISSMIEEINKIYNYFSKNKNPITTTINEFIADVNRRYGIINGYDRKKYYTERQEEFIDKYQDLNLDDLNNYGLQGVDDIDNDFKRPSPSMSYQTSQSFNNYGNHKYRLQVQTDYNLVSDLRLKIDSLFQKARNQLKMNFNSPSDQLDKLYSQISFNGMINGKKEEIKYAKTDVEKFDIVQSAINSLGQFSLTSLEKSLILFHEIVIFPLNILQGTLDILNNFNNIIEKCYTCVVGLQAWLKESQPEIVKNASNFVEFRSNGNVSAYQNYLLPFINNIVQVNGDPIVISVTRADTVLTTNTSILYGRQGLNKPAAPAAINFTYDNLIELIAKFRADNDEKSAQNILYRFAIDQGKLFLTLFESLFSQEAAFINMVDLKINVSNALGNKPVNNMYPGDTCKIVCYIDHSKLFRNIIEIFNGIKQNIDKFRGLIPDMYIKRYINDMPEKKGSLYHIEKELIFGLIQGKQTDDSSGSVNINFDNVNSKIEVILKYLTKPWNFNARDFLDAVGTHKPDNFNTVYNLKPDGSVDNVKSYTHCFHEFDREIDELVYYDPFNLEKSNGGEYTLPLVDATTVKNSNSLDIILFNISNAAKNGVAIDGRWMGVPLARYTKLYNNWKTTFKDPMSLNYYDNRKSLLYEFNRLVASYIKQVYDSNTKKIYHTTINSFANGAFSAAVMNNMNFNDEAVEPINDILHTTGYKGVLYRSLAIILRQFLIEMDGKNINKLYLQTDINEIPLFIKERLKANLPIFHKLFSMLIKRAELIKHFIKGLNVCQSTNVQDTGITKRQVLSEEDVKNASTAKSREQNEKLLLEITNQIIQGCMSLMQCIKETLNELASNAKYLDTYQNFISIYENENGNYPFMPISSIGYCLKDMDLTLKIDNDVLNPFLPEYDVGELRFKLLYGTQKILNSDSIKLDDIPGIKYIIKQHNSSVDKRHNFDNIDQFIQNVILLSGGILNLRNYAPLFNKCYGPLYADLSNTDHSILYNTKKILIDEDLKIYQALNNTKLIDVINLTESVSQKEQKSKIINTIMYKEGCPGQYDRDIMIVFNIIDLNVIPINFHALMREIPLINLINYSNTFDSLVKDMMGTNINDSLESKINKNGEIVHKDLTGNNQNKLLFYALLIDPYIPLSYNVYEDVLSNIIRGNIGIGDLGRPKYIGDEIYNKALFGEIYPGEIYYEEGGPSIGEGKRHGIQQVLTDSVADIFGTNYTNFIKEFVTGVLGYFTLAIMSGFDPNIDNTDLLDSSFPGFPNNMSFSFLESLYYLFLLQNPHHAPMGANQRIDIRNTFLNCISAFTGMILNKFIDKGIINDNMDMVKKLNNDILNDCFQEIKTWIDDAGFNTQPDVYALPGLGGALSQFATDMNNLIGITLDENIKSIISIIIISIIPFFCPNFKQDLYERITKLFINPGQHMSIIADLQTKKNDYSGVKNILYKSDLLYLFISPISLIINILSTINEDLVGTPIVSLDTSNLTINDKIIYGYYFTLNQLNISQNIVNFVHTYTDGVLYPIKGYGPGSNIILYINTASNLLNLIICILMHMNTLPQIYEIYTTNKNLPLSDQTKDIIKYSNPRYFSENLHYLDTDGNKTTIVEIPIEKRYKKYLQYLGFLRFHTIFTRNIIWLTNIQRILRLKLRKDLSWYDTRIVKDLSVTDPNITELYGNRLEPAMSEYDDLL